MVATQREGLIVRDVHDELLVFHEKTNEATTLNPSAAVVFAACDGTNTVDSVRQALDAAGLGPATDDLVWLALNELSQADLIDLEVQPLHQVSRRDMLKKIGVGAAATAAILPIVESIRAPRAAAQSSDNTNTTKRTTTTTAGPTTTTRKTTTTTTAGPTTTTTTTAEPEPTPVP